MKTPLLLSIIFVLSACATPGAREARLTFRDQKLTADEEKASFYLGDVVTAVPSEFNGDEDEAKRELRAYANRRGADFVVIERMERRPCSLNPEASCMFMKGQAYRAKTAAEIAEMNAPAPVVADKVETKAAAPKKGRKGAKTGKAKRKPDDKSLRETASD